MHRTGDEMLDMLLADDEAAGLASRSAWDITIDLVTSVIVSSGTATLAGAPRATVATVEDYEGRPIAVLANEYRFKGANRFRNLLGLGTASSENNQPAAFTKSNCAATTTSLITFNAGGAEIFLAGAGALNLGASPNGRTFRFTVELTAGTASQVYIGVTDNTSWTVGAAAESVAIPITTIPLRYSILYSPTIAVGTVIALVAGTTAHQAQPTGALPSGTVNITKWMVEDVTGKSNQNPGPYVPVGTGAPQPSGVDGVLCTDYENGNYVVNNVVTEAKGPAINSSNSKWAWLPGVAGSYFSTPDSVANSITGDIAITVAWNMPVWAGGVAVFASKRGADNSYQISIDAAGLIQLVWWDSGAVARFATSTVSIVPNSNTAAYIAFSLDVDNGASGRTIIFYTSPNGIAWTALGAPVVQAGVTNIFNGTSALNIGTDGSTFTAGKCYRVRVFNSIDFASAQPVVDFNPNASTGAGWNSATTGEAWTINGAANIFAGAGLWDARGPVGYLSEPAASTQLLLAPEDFTVNWAPGSGVDSGVTANAGISPRGDLTADLIFAKATNALHNTLQAIAKAASALPYVFDINIKPSGYNFATFRIDDGAGNGVWCGFNTQTGAITQAATAAGVGFTIGVAEVRQMPFGYWRCILTFTSNAAVTLRAVVNVDTTGTNNPFTPVGFLGDGVSGMLVWGGNLKQQTVIDSYNVSNATRNADALAYTVPAVGGPVTIAMTGTPNNNSISSGAFVSLCDGTAANNQEIYFNAATNVAVVETIGGVPGPVYAVSGVTPSAGIPVRMAYTAQTGDTRASANGLFVSGSATGTAPSGLTQIRIGAGFYAGGQPVNVRKARFRFTPPAIFNDTRLIAESTRAMG